MRDILIYLVRVKGKYEKEILLQKICNFRIKEMNVAIVFSSSLLPPMHSD